MNLQLGMVLRTLKRVKMGDRSLNQPGSFHVPAGSYVVVSSWPTRYGDVGANRDYILGQEVTGLRDPFFREGWKTRYPYDFGIVDPEVWEFVHQLEDGELALLRNAPHEQKYGKDPHLFDPRSRKVIKCKWDDNCNKIPAGTTS